MQGVKEEPTVTGITELPIFTSTFSEQFQADHKCIEIYDWCYKQLTQALYISRPYCLPEQGTHIQPHIQCTTRVIASKISSSRLAKWASEEALISKKIQQQGDSSCSSLWIIKGSGIEPHYCKLSPFVNKPNTEQVWCRNQLRWPIGNTSCNLTHVTETVK